MTAPEWAAANWARHPGGADLRVDAADLDIALRLPKLGRPHLGGGAGPVALPADTLTVVAPAGADPVALAAAVVTGRLALGPVTGGEPLPLTVGAAEVTGEPDGSGRHTWRVSLTAQPADRCLYDLVLLESGSAPTVLAPHAFYHRVDWADCGIAHISDPHVARRIDAFRGILRDLGHAEAAQRVVNLNDRFRGFVRFANALHAAGELDLVVATGDLVDYLYEADDDRAGLGNAGFLRDLVLGRAPGPDFPDVEPLAVPILMTPGNHDYRLHPYRLVFDLRMVGVDLQRVRNFRGYHLLEREARDLDNALYDPGATEVADLHPSTAERMIAIDTSLRAFREALADPEPYVAVAGPHRIVLVDSAHDVGGADSLGGALWELVKQWAGTGSEDFATLTGGSPNCEGVDDAEYAAALAALDGAPDDGLVIVALHAPLVNPWRGEYPYFLRQTQRPAQAGQAHLWVSAQSGGRHGPALRDAHPGWFAAPDQPEPDWLAQGSSQDLLDYGVSRGRTDDLLRTLAGVGARRPADLVLAGHTHHHDEISVRVAPDGRLRYHLDFYTANPRAGYPARVVVEQPDLAPNDRLAIDRESAYVEVEPEAIAGAVPHRMPVRAKHAWVVHVPPYPDPLDRTGDPAAWWSRHRPLLLQTASLGLLENDQVSFAGFRLVSVRGGVAHRIDHVPIDRLEQAGYRLTLEQAVAPALPRTHRHVERSRRTGAPEVSGGLCLLAPADRQVHSVVHRDGDGRLVELWDAAGQPGSGRLADRAVAPAAAGDPAAYLEADGTAVVLYRGGDGHVHSLYWRGGAAARHDALSQSAGAPPAVGEPTGYELAGMKHVFYRCEGGHLQQLWWTDGSVGQGRISGYCGEPRADGDPWGYPVHPNGQNVVLYRGVDGHVHSLYWSDGPTGHDNLTGYVGSPLAAGQPCGYHRPDDDSHQVVYRGIDGHVHEVWWTGGAAASWWDVTAAAGAPSAASDPAAAHLDGIKHVVHVGTDGHLHDLAWRPGQGVTWTDLTAAALAPPARPVRPVVAGGPSPGRVQVCYVGTDDQVHEIRWG